MAMRAVAVLPPDWRSLENQAWIGRPPAAVTVLAAHHTSFERCRFEHLASTGLDYLSGTHDDLIEGCIFRDIGGNGIQMGGVRHILSIFNGIMAR